MEQEFVFSCPECFFPSPIQSDKQLRSKILCFRCGNCYEFSESILLKEIEVSEQVCMNAPFAQLIYPERDNSVGYRDIASVPEP